MAYADRKNNPEDNDQAFTFETILDHRKGKSRKYEVLVQWSTGETTWEPLRLMIKEDPITMAKYAADNDLLNEDQWRRLRTYHRERKHILKLVVKAMTGRKRGVHYKFGVQVPNDYNHTV